MVMTGSRSIDTTAARVCAVAADEVWRMDDEEWMRWLWRLGEKGKGMTPSLPAGLVLGVSTHLKALPSARLQAEHFIVPLPARLCMVLVSSRSSSPPPLVSDFLFPLVFTSRFFF
jgi:hypothetical protein